MEAHPGERMRTVLKRNGIAVRNGFVVWSSERYVLSGVTSIPTYGRPDDM
jgi:hypothetical protein